MKVEKKILPRLPPVINLYISYRCNSRCAHCFLMQNDLLNKHEIDKDRIMEREYSTDRGFLL
jgi:MoaA/NifB/PqqE/SkfB family radical SAM enzyme